MGENELSRSLAQIKRSADIVYGQKDYTSATILYFKALFLLCDIVLLRRLGQTPKDHTERFRMLQESDAELYLFLDKYFKVYRDTYTRSIERSICEGVKNNVEELIRQKGI